MKKKGRLFLFFLSLIALNTAVFGQDKQESQKKLYLEGLGIELLCDSTERLFGENGAYEGCYINGEFRGYVYTDREGYVKEEFRDNGRQLRYANDEITLKTDEELGIGARLFPSNANDTAKIHFLNQTALKIKSQTATGFYNIYRSER